MLKTKSIKSSNRRLGKHQTTFFNQIIDINDQKMRVEEMKHLLKENLYVKPIQKKIDVKYSISDLKDGIEENVQCQGQKNRIQYRHIKNKSVQMIKSKFVIHSNQLSQAFSSNFSLKLNDIKNHSIHCSHSKSIVNKEVERKLSKKLELKRGEQSKN